MPMLCAKKTAQCKEWYFIQFCNEYNWLKKGAAEDNVDALILLQIYLDKFM